MELLAARDHKSFFFFLNGNWLATLSSVLQVISSASPYRHDWTKIKSNKWLKVGCCKLWHFTAWEPGLNLTQAMVGVLPAAHGESHTRMTFYGDTKLCGAHCSVSSRGCKSLAKEKHRPGTESFALAVSSMKTEKYPSFSSKPTALALLVCCCSHLREGSQDLRRKSEWLARQVMMAPAQLHVSLSKWHLHTVSSISRDCMHRLLHFKCAPRMRTQRTVI